MTKKDNLPSYKQVTGRDMTTCLIYYGGKTTLAPLIVDNMPPHVTFVDVFGGGAAVTLFKGKSVVEVYNDIGNVSNFFQVLRDNGPELYRRLQLTAYSRQEFQHCASHWEKEMISGDPIEWARMWYVTVSQGYTHEEKSTSWHMTKVVDAATAFANHVDKIPWVVERFRRIHIEHLDFAKLIDLYDKVDTLFYCDPPYLHESRVSRDAYLNEMSYNRHVELLERLLMIRGQCIVSGYPSDLYDIYLKKWRRVERSRPSAIQSTVGNRPDKPAMRTEVLWIREHHYGLWAEQIDSGTSSAVSV